MARQRDPNRDKAFEIYKEHNGEITNRAIAETLDVLEKTVSAWKSRDKWAQHLNSDECSTTNKKCSTTNGNPQYYDEENIQQTAAPSQEEERKRGGNPNPVKQFTERNSVAMKHGLFSRYIPRETLELMGMLDDKSPADLIWDQIQLQYAAIIRAQSIMFVESKEEMIKEIKKEKYGYSEVETTNENGETEMKYERTLDEVEYDFQFAWDRQAQFLNAQSRAISELRTSIKQFVSMAAEDDERRVKLEQMRLNVVKTKEETIRLQKMNEAGDQQSTEEKLAEYFSALQGAFTNEPTNE